MYMHELKLRAPTRGIWGHAPQENLDFRPSEVVSHAIVSNMAEAC